MQITTLRSAARRAVIAITLTVSCVLLAACQRGTATPCGDDYCFAGYRCEQIPAENGALRERCVQPDFQPGTCGNGLLEPDIGELCDDGNNVDGDECSFDCSSTLTCGNGIVDVALGEQCDCRDDGVTPDAPLCSGRNNDASGGYCNLDCQLHCGDGPVARGRHPSPPAAL